MSIHLILGSMFCFALGTPVVKYDNNVCKIEELKEEDVVMGDDFGPREVMDVCEGTALLYTVKLDNGFTFRVTENHILVVYDSKTNKLIELGVLDYLALLNSDVTDQDEQPTPEKNTRYKTIQISENNEHTYHDFTITEFGEGSFYGIQVDGNERFLLDGGYVVHNSGKTSELIRLYSRSCKAKKNCIVIKYSEDTRYSNEHLATHDGRLIPAVSTSLLFELENQCLDKDVIFIDEVQFYDDCLEFCEKMANSGKQVIASGLNSDFQRLPFNDNMSRLVACADHITHYTAVCMKCGSENGSFTKRIVAGDQKKVIGGEESYIAVCRKCFYDNKT
jgi:thymidine kinase